MAAGATYSSRNFFEDSAIINSDVNGDGYADVMATGSHTVYVYYGTSNGFSFGASGYAASIASPVSGTLNFGFQMVSAGDFNGDGFGDVIVTDPCLAKDGSAPTCSGTVGTGKGNDYLFLSMGSSGLAASLGGDRTTASQTWNVGVQTGPTLGSSISIGDVNADGFFDLLDVSDAPSGVAGEAFLFCGAATPSSTATVVWGPQATATKNIFGPGAL